MCAHTHSKQPGCLKARVSFTGGALDKMEPPDGKRRNQIWFYQNSRFHITTPRVHRSILHPHPPALIAPLHMIPQIRLLRLKNSGFIWRVANIAFITFFAKEKEKCRPKWLSDSSITAGKDEKRLLFHSQA